MKKDLTEIVFIIDCSGSMSGFEADTVGGFNSTVNAQRSKEGDALVTAYLFSNDSRLLYDRVSLECIAPMAVRDFVACGCTALYDAVGEAICHISNIHKYARADDVPEHTVFVITTDGMENASHKYSHSDIRKMIEEKRRACGWEFVFLAANIDVEENARKIGIAPERAISFTQSSEGIGECYHVMCDAITTARSRKKPDDASWRRSSGGKK